MKSMQDAWREYRDQVYDGPIPARQNLECHQAFFAGALSVVSALTEIEKLPENQGVVALGALSEEIITACRARLHTLKTRN